MDLAANAELYPDCLRQCGQVVVYSTGTTEAKMPAQPLLVNVAKLEFILMYELEAAERKAAGNRHQLNACQQIR
jgi:NADPH:quinone reductase